MALIKSLHVMLYLWSTMIADLSVTIQDIWWYKSKSALFLTPSWSDAITWGDFVRISKWTLPHWKLGWRGYLLLKTLWSTDLSLIHLATIPACDRWTDRQIDYYGLTAIQH